MAADELAAFRSILNRLRIPAPDRARVEEALHLVKRRLAVRRRVEIAAFVVAAAAILGLFWVGLGAQTAIGFIVGAVFSALCGYVGMAVTTRGNTRVAEAEDRKSVV